MKRKIQFLWGVIIITASMCSAADTLSLCYHYGCKKSVSVTISPELNEQIKLQFGSAKDASKERSVIASASALLYREIAQTTPLFADKGGNFRDGTADGRMDCADHSHNNTEILRYFAKQGWLRHHQVLSRGYRAPRFFDLHYTAVIVDQDGKKWAVDSWFEDFGTPPYIIEWKTWRRGWSPENTEAQRP